MKLIEKKDEICYPRFKESKETVSEIMDNLYRRMTLTDLEREYGVDSGTIRKWPGYFKDIMYDKVNKKLKKGKYSRIWHIDILTLNLKGKELESYETNKKYLAPRHVYIWACIDNKTKVVLATHVSEHKASADCADFLKKLTIFPRPKVIVTDGEYFFKSKIQDVFNKEKNEKHRPVKHILLNRYNQLNWNNNITERFFQKIISKFKYRKSLGQVRHGKGKTSKLRSLEIFIWMSVVYYNFVESHNELGKTPAGKARIGITPVKKFRHMRDILTEFVTSEDVIKYQANKKWSVEK